MANHNPTSGLKPLGKSKILIVTGIIISVIAGLFYFSKTSSAARKGGEVDPAYGSYITAYSGGVISRESAIRLRLAEEFQDSAMLGQLVPSNWFKFRPAIEGKAYWTDSKTIEFRPDIPLKSGKSYEAIFKLGEIMDVPEELSIFEFSFQTMDQNFDLIIEGLQAHDKQNLADQQLTGQLITADIADAKLVEQLLTAEQGEESLTVIWDHFSDNKTHGFVVQKIIRKEKADKVKLSWNGKALNIAKSGGKEVEIPALGDFKLINSKVMHNPEQYVSLHFSDPIALAQNLNGLVTLDNVENLRFIIENNEVRVYPPVRQTGNKTIKLFPGIKNILNHKLKKGTELSLAFEQLKPAVRFVGKGVILPSTDGLVMPFEAVNLKAINVQITKIFEKNISQFLQVNSLDGAREIRRVGKPYLRKVIKLTDQGVTDLGQWNRFTLDLNQIIQTEPGAIYQVKLSFTKEHAVYNCPGQQNSDDDQSSVVDENWDNAQEDEFSYWDTYENYYYDPDYDWQERENPCHSSYYAYGRMDVVKNIMASNLGIIAKLGNGRQMVVTVTDMLTTQPLQGVSIDIYDYQHQLITSSTTDTDGFVKIDVRKKPFLIVAKRKDERGYLKVDDGNALSLSNFDVSGNVVQKGIKGFVYGERGVWRPGDNIYLTFILEDLTDHLPKKHPVIFELRNPKGQVRQKMVKTTSVEGMYHFAAKTNQDDLTGNWLATIKVGGVSFNKTIKVETIKPNRLKINLDFGTDKILSSQQNLTGNLNVKWLHGAPARNLKAEFDVILNQAKTVFPKYTNYTFDDPTRRFNGESQKIFEGKLNDNGETIISTSLSTNESAPGMLMAHFKGKVFESGGGFSVDRFSIPYYPYNSFVGLRTPAGDKARGMLLTDTTHVVSIATVDDKGNAVSRNGVEIELYKLEWRWWWDNSGQNVANYFGRSHRQAIVKEKINTINGKGDWQFKINYPEWGRFLVKVCDPVSGHCAGKIIYLDWPGWAGRGQREFPGGAAMLAFSADKDKYQVGEDVKISIPGNSYGRALISIENGSGVIEQHWIETIKGETPFLFTVTDKMAPNVYINVSLIQPHAQTVNDLPMRLYGILAIQIDNPNTRLQPVIDMAGELEPEKKVTIKISEAEGKPMAYTVAVVDEGLLDLTKFKTPDAWNAFYSREAIGVKTWDVYEEVIGAYGGNLERLLAIGGDGTGTEEENAKINRFKPVVTYLGPFYLKPNEKVEHSFIMPQYIGSVKTMVVAGHEGAYGMAEKVTPVRQSLMVLGTLPRVLGPGETVNLPANLFVSDDNIRNVKIGLKTNDILQVEGQSQKTATFTGASDQLVEFALKVKPKLGKGTVAISASSGGKNANHNIEIEVRNPNPPVVNVLEKLIATGQSWEMDFNNPGMAGTNSGMLEIYSIPPINLEKRMRYLLSYPHGCAEQTVSKAFPQLFLTRITDINETGQQKIQQNLQYAISRLQTFQNSDGGFSYWPGSGYFNDWTTSYIGHFLLEAEKSGYRVPNEMIRKWKQYQRKASRTWQRNKNYNKSTLIQAYRLYALALAESPEKGAMNRLRESGDLSNEAKWRLAAAYQIAGQPEAAKKLISQASNTVTPYQEMSFTFGSHIRDEAMILETLSLMGEKEKGFLVMKRISEYLSNNNRWMSTQTTAFCLIAASKFMQLEQPKGGISFNYALNNQASNSASTNLAIAQKSLNVDDNDNGHLKVTNTGKQQLYARFILEGTPAVGDQTAAEENLRINVLYKDIAGNMIDPTRIEQGSSFIAEVTVINPGLRGNYKEMALTQIFPSGWEINNARLDGIEYPGQNDKPQYQNIRDDRVYTYFDLPANKRKTFRVMLNASYAGRFYLPTVYCEAMYDNTINARKPGKWVEVTKAGVQ